MDSLVTTPADSLIVALDFPTAAAALAHVERLEGRCRWFKVGLELYFATGGSIVASLRERGFKVFLDLKLHDIPNTVAGGVQSVASLGASLLTVHAGGGKAMLEAAAEAAAKIPDAPRLLAVTVLTSMDARQLAGVGIEDSLPDHTVRLARLAKSAGITGMVCSAMEVGRVRSELDDDSLLVVPGVRPAGSELGDQRRVATPREAVAAGASMLVVGRPITGAANPAAAVEAILAEMEYVAPKLKPADRKRQAGELSSEAESLLFA